MYTDLSLQMGSLWKSQWYDLDVFLQIVEIKSALILIQSFPLLTKDQGGKIPSFYWKKWHDDKGRGVWLPVKNLTLVDQSRPTAGMV